MIPCHRNSPERKAKLLFATQGLGGALRTTRERIKASARTRSVDDWYWYWSSVAAHLDLIAKHPRRPRGKKQRRELLADRRAATGLAGARA
jgi:hypothetical protein